MTLTLYTFEDEFGTQDTFTTMDAAEARERARQYGMRLIANEFEYSDREVVEDNTGGEEP